MKRKLRMAALVVSVLAGTVGFAAAQDYRYYDRDGYYDRDDNRYDNRYYGWDGYGYENFRRGMHVAREFGYRDGAQVAREDNWHGKPFNPNPRGRYDDADHGYRRAFGDKHEYRECYSRAYREAYMSNYRGRSGYGYGY
jgi:hypothetical protein